MFIPGRFLPSSAVRNRQYDEEGRLREVRPGPGPHTDGDSGIAESNSLFATDAEMFGSITPVLKRNRIRDAKRRNYIVQPGGACIYFETQKELKDPYGGGRVQYTVDMPEAKESFGHDTQPGGPSQGQQGRRFTLGRSGGRDDG